MTHGFYGLMIGTVGLIVLRSLSSSSNGVFEGVLHGEDMNQTSLVTLHLRFISYESMETKLCYQNWYARNVSGIAAGGTMRNVLYNICESYAMQKAAAETADLQHSPHTLALINSSANQWHQG
ncbi:hypothetical protein Bca52824_001738 [Brassica carinata]|uniref:Uncharacterized protein n=1 Tax=Brassica carinata TaxID=52824 RepID=A0A8X7WGM6_BRACI|nr:hypothetical protein Bca52824_001738 [Brassica carinata]